MHEQGRDVCLEQGIEVSMGLYFRRGKLSADVKGNCCSGVMGRADEAATHLVQQDDTKDNVQEGKRKDYLINFPNQVILKCQPQKVPLLNLVLNGGFI